MLTESDTKHSATGRSQLNTACLLELDPIDTSGSSTPGCAESVVPDEDVSPQNNLKNLAHPFPVHVT